MKGTSEQKKNNCATDAPFPLEVDITRHPFFQGWSAEHLRLLAGCATRIEFAAGETIFRQGDVASCFYLIEQGRVAIEAGRPEDAKILIQTLGSGDALGWSWLFPPFTWCFGARTVEPTRAIFIYGTWLRAMAEQDPSFGYKLMECVVRLVIERMQAIHMQLVELSQFALKTQSQALQLAVQQGKLNVPAKEYHKPKEVTPPGHRTGSHAL